VSRIPPIVRFLGKKKSGKTTVTVAVAAELTRRGHRVMTIKHGHRFDLDREGSDSWRHVHEGHADRVVLAGPDEFAVLGGWSDGRPLGPTILAERFLPDADIVLVEGFKAEPLPCIEIYRRAAHDEPIFPFGAPEWAHYIAMATDVKGVEAPFPVLDVDAPDLAARLADIIARQTGAG
jgi:molybdopterin-guanine dinucleotide biosynthesis protein B